MYKTNISRILSLCLLALLGLALVVLVGNCAGMLDIGLSGSKLATALALPSPVSEYGSGSSGYERLL